MQQLRDLNKRNNEVAKRRFAAHDAEKTQFNATIADLQAQIVTLTAERDELTTKAQETAAVDTSAKEQELSRELEALRTEKADLERRLQELAAAPPAETQSAETEELKAELVSHILVRARLRIHGNLQSQVRQEKDALEAEKATWVAGATSPEDSQAAWESEKAALTKARDEALQRAKVRLHRENLRRRLLTSCTDRY